jgi:hypothetical protein
MSQCIRNVQNKQIHKARKTDGLQALEEVWMEVITIAEGISSSENVLELLSEGYTKYPCE